MAALLGDLYIMTDDDLFWLKIAEYADLQKALLVKGLDSGDSKAKDNSSDQG